MPGGVHGASGVNAMIGGAGDLPRRRAVYVDDAIWEWQGLKWAHLLADDVDDLHRFAARLGIHRVSYQGTAANLGSPLRSDLIRTATGDRVWRHCLRPQ